VIQLCECLQNLERNANDVESKMFSVQIVYDYFRVLQKQKESDEQIFDLKMKKYKNWKTEDWQVLVNLMIKEELDREPSLESGISMLRCRLMINDRKIFEIIDMLNNLISMDKQRSLRSKYEILKITLNTHDVYFKKFETNQTPISHLIQRMDTLNESFYHECCETVTLLYEFWANVVAYRISIDDEVENIPMTVFVPENQSEKLESISESSMERIILEVGIKIHRLETLLKKISKISFARQEIKALNCIKFLATYSHENHDDVNPTTLESEKLDGFSSHFSTSKDFSEYFEAVESKITKISLKFSTELGYRKLEVVGESLNFLMPKVYKADIEDAITNHNEPYLKIPYLVPIICADNSILLKSITSHV
jgi:hypothetical protein